MKHKSISGFTVIEMVTVVGIIMLLFGILTINLINIRPRSTLNTHVATIISDVKKQQLRAMTGNLANNLISDYGIYFEESRYTLFEGSVYSSSAPTNVVINLDDDNRLTNIKFPGSTIVFNKGEGSVNNFINGANTISVRNTITNEQKTLTINKLGVIVLVN